MRVQDSPRTSSVTPPPPPPAAAAAVETAPPVDAAAHAQGLSDRAAEFARAQPGAPTTLDGLAALSHQELTDIYAGGAVPKDLTTALVGAPKGRMLAVRGAGAAQGVLRTLARAGWFPWDGKTFSARRPDEGDGINRVQLAGAHMKWFPFQTREVTSVVDGKPCIYLDYEQPGNPWFIAKIRDEIREVAPGLWLGPAMWKKDDGAVHVLWFALDFNTPSKWANG